MRLENKTEVYESSGYLCAGVEETSAGEEGWAVDYQMDAVSFRGKEGGLWKDGRRGYLY